MTGTKPIPIKERFFRHVKKTNTCWLWTANTYKCGYGQFGIGSRSDGTRKKAAAHRISWEIHKGFIPKGILVLHICNIKECVNPKHLYLGDHQANMDQAVKDGRFKRTKKWIDARRGSKNPASKLTEFKVLEIRKKYSNGSSQDCLALEYGINQTKIGSIVRRETWKHI